MINQQLDQLSIITSRSLRWQLLCDYRLPQSGRTWYCIAQIIRPWHIMLRIGKLTDYAMLIISRLAKNEGAILSATTLAEELHLTAATVSKVLKILSEAGLVSALRGAVGGYHLAKPAVTITVADIIQAMEGQFAVTECCELTNKCALNSVCAMRDNWRKINKVIHSMLGGLTILDMLEPISLSRLTSGK